MNLFFSDVYRNVNYTGSLAKFTYTPFGVHVNFASETLQATQCSLHFDKPQKNEIHSFSKFSSRSKVLSTYACAMLTHIRLFGAV